MLSITVYQKGDAFRVVKGEHARGEFGKSTPARTYISAEEAFTTEGDTRIKAAIARIAPAVLRIPATAQHHIERATSVAHAEQMIEKAFSTPYAASPGRAVIERRRPGLSTWEIVGSDADPCPAISQMNAYAAQYPDCEFRTVDSLGVVIAGYGLAEQLAAGGEWVAQ